MVVALPEERPRFVPDRCAVARVVRTPLPVDFAPPVVCVVPERVLPEACELRPEVLRRVLVRVVPRVDAGLRADEVLLRPAALLDDLLLDDRFVEVLPGDFEREALLVLRPDFFAALVFEPVRLVVFRLMSASEFCAHPRRVSGNLKRRAASFAPFVGAPRGILPQNGFLYG